VAEFYGVEVKTDQLPDIGMVAMNDRHRDAEHAVNRANATRQRAATRPKLLCHQCP
jgi:hypothetical protein